MNSIKGLRKFSKLTVFFTLLFIFSGGMVTSTRSGLSVPDWPNTYGYFMFANPIQS
ncbi:MAG: COX15/CtaA family protein [Candidatus Marinimicrobia bacterium]|nr:COX15/CtaA family protein [Candidatus Neomarinimicrobiota bacterium]